VPISDCYFGIDRGFSAYGNSSTLNVAGNEITTILAIHFNYVQTHLQYFNAKLQVLHQMPRTGRITSYRMVCSQKECKVRRRANTLLIFFSGSKTRRLETIIRCSALIHLPWDVQDACNVDPAARESNILGVTPQCTGGKAGTSGSQLSCNRSATELGAFHDGREERIWPVWLIGLDKFGMGSNCHNHSMTYGLHLTFVILSTRYVACLSWVHSIGTLYQEVVQSCVGHQSRGTLESPSRVPHGIHLSHLPLSKALTRNVSASVQEWSGSPRQSRKKAMAKCAFIQCTAD